MQCNHAMQSCNAKTQSFSLSDLASLRENSLFVATLVKAWLVKGFKGSRDQGDQGDQLYMSFVGGGWRYRGGGAIQLDQVDQVDQ
jgi:hypothetical protein